MNSKRLQQISESDGLQATYGGGDYTVTVWANESFENGEDYEMVFTRMDTDIPHQRKFVSTANLESEMRAWQSDLRKWRKVEFNS